MSSYRINGIKYNPANWAGLDATERAACNRFAAARERELNMITTQAWACHGGPFDGHTIELENTTDRSAPLTVGAWAGVYAVQKASKQGEADRLMWLGTDGGAAVETHTHTTDTKRAGADVTGKGFEQLRDLLADLAEDPAERAIETPTGPMARYTIGRTVYTIQATPEAADKLRARVIKAKRWFADKLVSAPRIAIDPIPAPDSTPTPPRSPQADHEAARAAVASVRAIAQAQAGSASEGIEQRREAAAPVASQFTGQPDPRHSPPMQSLDGLTVGELVNVPTRTGGPRRIEALFIRSQTITGEPWHMARLLDEQTGKRLDVLTALCERIDTTTTQAGELVTCDGPDQTDTAAATPPTHTPPDLPGAIGQADTPPSGQPEHCTDPLKTRAQAGHCTGPLKTPAASLRAEFFGASGRGAAQKTASKTGAWRADMFRTERGSCAMIFTGADGVYHCTEYPSGADRMRALQAMAREAEQARRAGEAPAHTPANLPGAIGQADTPPAGQPEHCADPLKTPAQPDPAPAVFERTRPAHVDLRELIAQGMRPADLVGLGVAYRGDMANASGQGAIVSACEDGPRGLWVDITLEDGRHLAHVDGRSFAQQPGNRYALNFKNHGAPYLAQLAATRATATAAHTSAKHTQAQSHAAELLRLAAEFPQLERAESRHAGGKLAARNIRTLLKAAFPGVKFSVTSDYNSARIGWTDGPTNAAVSAIVGRFDIGRSDTQSDYFYTEASAWSELFGGVQYLTTSRTESPELIARALAEHFPNEATRPSEQDWKKAQGVFDWCNGCQHTRRQFRERLQAMNTAAPAKTRKV